MTLLWTLLKSGSDVLFQTFTVLVYRPSFLGYMQEQMEEEQFGFWKGKGTRDAIGVLRIMCERYLEKNKKLYVVFVDIEKAFDRVDCNKLMGILKYILIYFYNRYNESDFTECTVHYCLSVSSYSLSNNECCRAKMYNNKPLSISLTTLTRSFNDKILLISVNLFLHSFRRIEANTVKSLMLAGNEFQSLGRAIVKEDEYVEVQWDGIVSIVSWRERVFRLWWEESEYADTFFVYGFHDDNALTAVEEYRRRFPNVAMGFSVFTGCYLKLDNTTAHIALQCGPEFLRYVRSCTRQVHKRRTKRHVPYTPIRNNFTFP
ncbi:hypothetical protein ANN_07630 [Periplaneta americana]|uniref:Reverse transcriptase domain-containing protein n=1 Tax=Periplaneta americana TaxID=6978 RepID=A0ABQ8T0E4_PERAM|nr:hypothetical protein ANN_07630 [Periplaneta americana]